MSKRLVKIVLAVMLGAIICLPGVAGAVSTLGPAVNTSTGWDQAFELSGVGNFDVIEAFITSGAQFNNLNQGLTNFQDPGPPVTANSDWFGSVINPTYTTAFPVSFSPYTALDFTIAFAGDKDDPLSFDFVAWNGGDVAEHVGLSWSGGASPQWTIGAPVISDVYAYDRTSAPVSAVPIPSALLLLSSGLAGLGVVRWRGSRS